MRYFASRTPSVNLYLSTGPVVKWPHPGNFEGMIEVDETKKSNEPLIAAIQTCIETGTGGDIREVDAAEFAEWQKKTQGVRPIVRRREEFSGGVAVPTDRGRRSSSPSQSPASPAVVDPGTADPAPVQSNPAPTQPVSSSIPTRRRGGG